jgi:hypothetical protein
MQNPGSACLISPCVYYNLYELHRQKKTDSSLGWPSCCLRPICLSAFLPAFLPIFCLPALYWLLWWVAHTYSFSGYRWRWQPKCSIRGGLIESLGKIGASLAWRSSVVCLGSIEGWKTITSLLIYTVFLRNQPIKDQGILSEGKGSVQLTFLY